MNTQRRTKMHAVDIQSEPKNDPNEASTSDDDDKMKKSRSRSRWLTPEFLVYHVIVIIGSYYVITASMSKSTGKYCKSIITFIQAPFMHDQPLFNTINCNLLSFMCNST